MPEHSFNDQQKARMDSPARRKLLPQDKILPLLTIEDKNTILDIGAGAGYFTFPLAEQTEGCVYALDIDQKMLDYIAKKASEENIKNVTLLRAKLESMPFNDQEIHHVLACMVLHEVKPLENALKEIYRVLKPGGRFVVVDWIPEPNDRRANRIDSGTMQRVSEQVGFDFDTVTIPSDKVYAIAFTKPSQQ